MEMKEYHYLEKEKRKCFFVGGSNTEDCFVRLLYKIALKDCFNTSHKGKELK